MTLFEKDFEDVSQGYLKKKGPFLGNEKAEYLYKEKQLGLKFLENIMYYDTICIKVYGENVPLAILLNIFGLSKVEELIEQNAIEFILWAPTVVYPIENVKGITPLASAYATSEPHCIPEVSLKLGFNWLAKDIGVKAKKRLARKLEAKYRLAHKETPKNAVDLTWATYSQNRFACCGVQLKDSMELTEEDKSKICKIADNIMEIEILAENNLVSRNDYFNTRLINDAFKNIKSKIKLDKNILVLNQIENIPDIGKMLLTGQMTVDDVFEIRKKGETVKFRKWLYEQTYASDTVHISEEYIRAISNPIGFFEKRSTQLVKTIACYGLGLGISTLFTGVLSPIVGITIGTALDISANLGLSLFDTFLLSSLTKGWTPKLFIDEIKKVA